MPAVLSAKLNFMLALFDINPPKLIPTTIGYRVIGVYM